MFMEQLERGMRQYVWRSTIMLYALGFLPPAHVAEENYFATLATYAYFFTLGLVYYTPLWTYLDNKCVEACDMHLLDAVFDATCANMARELDVFMKDGFDRACKTHKLRTPQAYDPHALPPNDRVWVKPKDGGCGRGHFIHDTSAPLPEDASEYMFQEICEPHEAILELLAHKHLATFRIQTLSVCGSQPECVPPYILRVGPEGSICDNDQTKSGRHLIFVEADGTIETVKTWPENEVVNTLPSGMELTEGHKIPKFGEMLALARRAHEKLCPHSMTVGWDVAMTTKGIQLIEVNYCSPVIEYFRPRLWLDVQDQKPDHLKWLFFKSKLDIETNNSFPSYSHHPHAE